MGSLNHKIVMWYSGDGCTVKEQWSLEQFQTFLHTRSPRPEMAHTFQKLMLVEVQQPLRVVGVVCFTLPMDAQGCVRNTWELPLDQILSMGDSMVVQGYGPVSVAALGCSSVNWYAHFLWRPVLESDAHGTFVALKKAVDENPLGLPVYQDMSRAFDSLASDPHSALDGMFASFQHSMKLDDMRPHEVDDLWRGRFETSQQQMIDLVKSLTLKYQELLKNERTENKSLTALIDRLMTGIERESQQMSAATLAVNTSGPNNKSGQWVRWFVRNNTDDGCGPSEGISVMQIAQGMAYAGIQLVTAQPGIGHVIIPPEGLERYLDNPTAYMAEHFGVSEKTYRDWRTHFNAPSCRAVIDGRPCQEAIVRCESPKQFIIGFTDYCRRHQLSHAEREKRCSTA